jgi:hypothetical protein
MDPPGTKLRLLRALAVTQFGTKYDTLLYQLARNRFTLIVMGHSLTVSKDSTSTWRKKRDDLSTKRNALFKKYSNNPNDVTLALEIKTMDDEIAEYTAKMRDETVSERKKPLVTQS